MKKLLVILLIAFMAIGFVSCIRPANYPGLVTLQTNEIAFLVDMTGDDSQSGRVTDIQRKDIPIPTYWVRTGRWDYQGYWRPAVKVIAVSQAPARINWDDSDSNMTVRMTSQESAGFVVPMIVNAFIDTREDAELYLRSFRPVVEENINWANLTPKQWGEYAKENAQPLEIALNSVVYPRVMELLAPLFVRTPILNAEVASKIYIPAVFNGSSGADLTRDIQQATGVRLQFDDVPSIRDWAKEAYGITITAMAFGDGVIYDDRNIQQQIDTLAVAVMRERALAQEQTNARAEQQVRVTQAETLRREAELQGQTATTRLRLQEIENSRMIAEATAKAIENGKVVPQGSYPIGLTSLIITPNYNSLGR